MTEIIVIAVLAAILGLDVNAVGRIMVSRPIICAPLVGYILGDVKSGLWIGIIIELLWIGDIPLGAAIPYDTTVLSVITAYWGIEAVPGYPGSMMLAMAVAIPAMVLHNKLKISLRYLNIRIAHWVETGVINNKEDRIAKGIFMGILFNFLKNLVFYLAILFPGKLLVNLVFQQLPFDVVRMLEISIWLLPLAGIGIVLVSFHGKFPCPK
ncbi:MAG: PTS sugar transporter subunit IIC [Elusimicrobiota bacterium]